MLYPRLTNCSECASIPELLKRIDCKLAELGNSLYNNISFMLNQSVPAGDILQLIAYKRILMYKYINPNYVYHYSISKIASKVILLTPGCNSKPLYTPTVRETTTTTTTPCPTTTTTTTAFCDTWYYNVTVFFCDCTEISNQTLSCGIELNIGSFYYAPLLDKKVRINGVDFPCDDAGAPISVDITSEAATCVGVVCPTTTTTTTAIAVYSYDLSSGELTSEVPCLEIFTSDTVYTTTNILNLGTILYNNSLLGSVKVGNNLWYKDINSNISYQIDNSGVIVDIFTCVV